MANTIERDQWKWVHRIASAQGVWQILGSTVSGIAVAIWSKVYELAPPVVATLGVLAAASVLWLIRQIRSLVQSRQPTAALVNARVPEDREIESLKYRLVQAEQTVAKEQERCSQLAIEKAKAIDDYIALVNSTVRSVARWRQMYWRVEHDKNTPEFSRLSQEDLKEAQKEIGRFATVLEEMREALPPLVSYLRQSLLASGSSTDAAPWLGELLDDNVFRVCERSLSYVLHPENSELDPREAFLGLVFAFRTAWEWSERAAVILKIDASEVDQYIAWWTVKSTFREQIRQMPNVGVMKDLRSQVLAALDKKTLV